MKQSHIYVTAPSVVVNLLFSNLMLNRPMN